MARRARNKVEVSLFPFLSILACVIGTLTLMITALALGQMDTTTINDGLKLDDIRKQIRQLEQMIARTKATIEAKEGSLDDDEAERRRLEAELDALFEMKQRLLTSMDEDPEMPDAADIDAEAHRREIERIQTELEALDEQIKALLEQLAKMDEVEEADVVIQPSGSGTNVRPYFVECTANGLVIFEGNEEIRVRRAAMAKDEQFLALLDGAKKTNNGVVIFLVREDALSTYFAARAVALEAGARNGKLPVIGQGKIDLTRFKKFLD